MTSHQRATTGKGTGTEEQTEGLTKSKKIIIAVVVTFVSLLAILAGVYFYMRHKGKKLNEMNYVTNANNFSKYVEDPEPTFDTSAKRGSEDLSMQPLRVGIHDNLENDEKVEV